MGSIVRSLVSGTFLLDQCCSAAASTVLVPSLMQSWAQGAGRDTKLEPAAANRSVEDSFRPLCHAFSTAVSGSV